MAPKARDAKTFLDTAFEGREYESLLFASEACSLGRLHWQCGDFPIYNIYIHGKWPDFLLFRTPE